MKMNNWIIAGIAVLIFLFGAYISKIVGDKKLERLKVFSDSIKVVAQQRDSIANKYSDSIKAVNAELEVTKNKLVSASRVNRKIDAQLDTALASTTTDSGRVVILKQQVVNLRQANLNLESALAIANAQKDNETHRADSMQALLHIADKNIFDLNQQIRKLRPQLPKLVRYSFEVIKLGGAFYAGVKYGQSHPK